MYYSQVISNKVDKVSRYFRRNKGDDDYATIPEVVLAGDFVIEFDLFAGDSSIAGIVLGNSLSASSSIFVNGSNITVRDSDAVNIFTTGSAIPSNTFVPIVISSTSNLVRIFVSGVERGSGTTTGVFTFVELYSRQSGSLPLSGILANLKIYENGTLIRDYPLNEPKGTSVVYDTAGGNDGTIINGDDEDKGLFTKQADGDWLADDELITQPIDLVADWINVSGSTVRTTTWDTDLSGGIGTGALWSAGESLRLTYDVYVEANEIVIKDSSDNSLLDGDIITLPAMTRSSGYVDFTSVEGGIYLHTAGGSNNNEIFKFSVKEVLKSA